MEAGLRVCGSCRAGSCRRQYPAERGGQTTTDLSDILDLCCCVCGSLLAADEATTTLLNRFARLASFGLVDGCNPILTTRTG